MRNIFLLLLTLLCLDLPLNTWADPKIQLPTLKGNQGQGVGNLLPGNQGSGNPLAGKAGVPVPPTPTLPAGGGIVPNIPVPGNKAINNIINQTISIVPSNYPRSVIFEDVRGLIKDSLLILRPYHGHHGKPHKKLKKFISEDTALDAIINMNNIDQATTVEKNGNEVIFKTETTVTTDPLSETLPDNTPVGSPIPTGSIEDYQVSIDIMSDVAIEPMAPPDFSESTSVSSENVLIESQVSSDGNVSAETSAIITAPFLIPFQQTIMPTEISASFSQNAVLALSVQLMVTSFALPKPSVSLPNLLDINSNGNNSSNSNIITQSALKKREPCNRFNSSVDMKYLLANKNKVQACIVKHKRP